MQEQQEHGVVLLVEVPSARGMSWGISVRRSFGRKACTRHRCGRREVGQQMDGESRMQRLSHFLSMSIVHVKSDRTFADWRKKWVALRDETLMSALHGS